jgi:NAD(P)H dehydrogenase (quinone)
MRVLVIFAHPTRQSLCGSILSAALDELAVASCEVELLNLYSEKFDPVLQESEWRAYEQAPGHSIQPYVEQLKRNDGLICIFPTWNYGQPAILKGYIDRVWKPNVAFRIDTSRAVHFDQFDNLKFFIVATTFGASWLVNTWCGNPSRRAVAGGLRRHFPRRSSFAWLPIYNMDKPSLPRVERYLAGVRKTTRIFLSRHRT